MALRINAENFEEKVLKADKPVLVDFYSDTCIPCKQMACILGDLEDENEDALYIYKSTSTTTKHSPNNTKSCPLQPLSVS